MSAQQAAHTRPASERTCQMEIYYQKKEKKQRAKTRRLRFKWSRTFTCDLRFLGFPPESYILKSPVRKLNY